MNFFLTKKERLNKAPEIRSVLRSGNRVNEGEWTLRWRLADNRQDVLGNAKQPARFCVVVRKSAVASAVKRNRARRLAKEFFRLHKNKLVHSVDIVVQVNRFNALEYKDLEDILTVAFRKAGLWA